MSVFGIFIIFAYTVVILAVVVILHFLLLRRYVWRWVITVPMVLGAAALAAAPFLEEAQIASRFEELCRDAGIHVVRKVEAEGYFYDITFADFKPGPITNPGAIKEFERQGFQFIEYRGYRSGTHTPYYRVEKTASGWEVKRIEKPTARYRLGETLIDSNAEIPVGHRLWKQERILIDRVTGEMIARATTYKRIANTIDQLSLGGFMSTLRLCSGSYDLVSQTIVPVKRLGKHMAPRVRAGSEAARWITN
jgi:hypothetical protein